MTSANGVSLQDVERVQHQPKQRQHGEDAKEPAFFAHRFLVPLCPMLQLQPLFSQFKRDRVRPSIDLSD